MGMVKRAWMRRQARGFGEIPGKTVCPDCLSDLTLRGLAARHATSSTCSYCERDELIPIAAPMDALMPEIMEGINYEWAHPGDLLGWSSQEGGWLGGVVTDTLDLLQDLEVSNDEAVLGDIADAIDEAEWCEKNPFTQTRDKAMLSAWQQFSMLVKHRVRYLFLRVSATSDEERAGDELPPAQILDQIAKAIHEIDRGLVKDLEAGRVIYRARCQGDGPAHDSVESLGPPTEAQAVASTRMSAAGIPVFYGALDPDTAIVEKLERAPVDAVTMAVGEFTAERPLRVLDLSFPLPIPSLFDRTRRHLRVSTKFLRSYVRELSLPVEGDGREHIDYVPTQVAAEYFRQVFRCSDGSPLDGLLYRSAKNPPNAACVLFFGREGCAGRDEVLDARRLATVRLRYARSTRREIPAPVVVTPPATAGGTGGAGA